MKIMSNLKFFKMNKNVRIRTFKDYVGELTITYKRTSFPSEKIGSSNDAYKFLYKYFDVCMDSHEEFKVLHLSNYNRVVNVDHLSVGTKIGCLVDVSILLRNALSIMTKGLIIAHNHPSGNLKPSASDVQITRNIKNGCDAVGLKLLDSIILTREGYYSFTEESML